MSTVRLLVLFSFFSLSFSKLHSAFEIIDWISYYTGIGEQCTYVEDPAQVVTTLLQQHLIAQNRAIETVSNALGAWEFSRGKDRQPLVLALTGPTGTGKKKKRKFIYYL